MKTGVGFALADGRPVVAAGVRVGAIRRRRRRRGGRCGGDCGDSWSIAAATADVQQNTWTVARELPARGANGKREPVCGASKICEARAAASSRKSRSVTPRPSSSAPLYDLLDDAALAPRAPLARRVGARRARPPRAGGAARFAARAPDAPRHRSGGRAARRDAAGGAAGGGVRHRRGRRAADALVDAQREHRRDGLEPAGAPADGAEDALRQPAAAGAGAAGRGAQGAARAGVDAPPPDRRAARAAAAARGAGERRGVADDGALQLH